MRKAYSKMPSGAIACGRSYNNRIYTTTYTLPQITDFNRKHVFLPVTQIFKETQFKQ